MLEWDLRHREYEPKLQALRRQGKKVPVLDSKPSLDPHYNIYWEAFLQMSRCRSIGMAANPISISDIQAWCAVQGYTGDAAREFYEIITFMDSVWMSVQNEKMSSDETKDRKRRAKEIGKPPTEE